MRSLTWALTWEFARRGSGVVPLACLACLAIAAYNLETTLTSYRLFPGVNAQLGFLATALLVLVPAILYAQCDERELLDTCRLRMQRHLYRLPLAMWRAVVWQMVLGASTAAGLYLVVALSVNLFFGSDWPLWLPALGLVAAVVSTQAVCWGLAGQTILQAVLLVAGSIGILNWAVWRLGDDPVWHASHTAAETWSHVSTLEVTLASLAIPVALGLAVLGVARDRRGEPWPWTRWLERWDRKRWMERDGQSKTSPSTSLARFECRRMAVHWISLWSLLILPIGLAAAGGLWKAGVLEPHDAETGFIMSVFAVIMVRFLVALYGLVVSVRDLSAHRATLPVTDKQLAMGQLRAAALSVLMTFLTATGCLLASIVWNCCFGDRLVPWNLPALELRRMLVIWAFILLSATLNHWTLHGVAWAITDSYRCFRTGFHVAAALFTLVLGILIVVTAVSADTPDAQQWVQAMWIVVGAIVGLLCLGLVVHQYSQAVQRGLLPTWSPVAAAFAWLAIFGWMWMIGYLGESPTFAALLFSGGVVSLVTLAVPAAMLAVANDRHR